MHLLKIIIFIGLAFLLTHCGSQRSSKAEDGRIVLSSESDKFLIIPEGAGSGRFIYKQKMADKIAMNFDSVSEVFDISFQEELRQRDVLSNIATLGYYGLVGGNTFTLSFSIKTTTGKVYRNIQCEIGLDINVVTPHYQYFIIDDCNSGEVILRGEKDNIFIKVEDVLLRKERLSHLDSLFILNFA